MRFSTWVYTFYSDHCRGDGVPWNSSVGVNSQRTLTFGPMVWLHGKYCPWAEYPMNTTVASVRNSFSTWNKEIDCASRNMLHKGCKSSEKGSRKHFRPRSKARSGGKAIRVILRTLCPLSLQICNPFGLLECWQGNSSYIYHPEGFFCCGGLQECSCYIEVFHILKFLSI